MFSTNRYPSSQSVTKAPRSNPASARRGLRARLCSDRVQPQPTGVCVCVGGAREGMKNRKKEKNEKCCHIFGNYYCLVFFLSLRMTPCDVRRVSAGLASRGRRWWCEGRGVMGGREGWSCRAAGLQKSQQPANEHFAFNRSPFGAWLSSEGGKEGVAGGAVGADRHRLLSSPQSSEFTAQWFLGCGDAV